MGGWRHEGRAEQKCEEDKDKRNTGRGKEMGERGKETVRREKKRNQFKAREHVSFNKVRKSQRQAERENNSVKNCGKA